MDDRHGATRRDLLAGAAALAGTMIASAALDAQSGGSPRRHAAFDNVKLLVWFEQHSTMEHAIVREKRVKKWNRAWKLRLIEESNPRWRDLAEDFGFEPLAR